MTAAARVAAVYFAFAAVITGPALLSGDLLGHPDVDVWNHAWGFWWFWDTLAAGRLPFRTDLVGAPEGGVLYFIDPLGALAAMPWVAVFGATVAWNLVLLGRIAMAGWATHGLCRALSGPGAHNYVAGFAMASAPFLWVEIGNGISEVVAVGWIPASLWAAVAALPTRDPRRWALLGVCIGLATLSCFYYGLLSGILVGCLLTWNVLRGRAWRLGVGVSLAVALAFAAPGLVLLRRSLTAPDALVTRAGTLNGLLLEHNAVDPREWVMPGAFHSVDFAARYGEAFQHTLYLRWTVLALVGWACWRHRGEVALWVGITLVSAVLGLGTLLWWDGGWVTVGGRALSLPFGWLQALVPALAVTHPARLGLGAIVITSVIAGWGLKGVGRRALWVVPLLLAETILASNAQWPLPTSPAAVPDVYRDLAASDDSRAVLDLPANVGGTMATSRYFWYQTVHRKPVPWFPDVHEAHNGDRASVRLFEHTPSGPAAPLSAAAIAGLRERYGWIVVHDDLDRRTAHPGELTPLLTAAFGAPEAAGGVRVWRLGR